MAKSCSKSQKANIRSFKDQLDRSNSVEDTIDLIVIDSDVSFLKSAEEYFRSDSFNIDVKTYREPEKAIEKLEELNVDCIVSEYDIPGMNGIELLRKVRENYSELPFLIITDNGSEEIASKAISADVTNYIQKKEKTETFELLENSVKKSVSEGREKEETRKLRSLFEITFRTDLDFEEKIDKVTELGCEFFDMDVGGIAYIDPKSRLFEPEYLSEDHEIDEKGDEFDLDETYCQILKDRKNVKTVSNPESCGLTDTRTYVELGVKTYIGKRIKPKGERERSFWFISSEKRDKPFTDAERTFHNIMAQWIKYEIERTNKEQRLEEFASLVKHELRNLLINAEGFIGLAEDNTESEELLKSKECISQANEILEEVSAIPVTTNDLEKEYLSLENCFKEAYNKQSFDIEYNVEDGEVLAGRVNLVKVFEKLIENSVKHNDRKVQIRAGVMEDGFYYEEDGKGLPENKRGDVLERGYSETENSQGLGLYIVKRIADTHGWKLHIKHSETGGIRFNFYTGS